MIATLRDAGELQDQITRLIGTLRTRDTQRPTGGPLLAIPLGNNGAHGGIGIQRIQPNERLGREIADWHLARLGGSQSMLAAIGLNPCRWAW